MSEIPVPYAGHVPNIQEKVIGKIYLTPEVMGSGLQTEGGNKVTLDNCYVTTDIVETIESWLDVFRKFIENPWTELDANKYYESGKRIVERLNREVHYFYEGDYHFELVSPERFKEIINEGCSKKWYKVDR